MADAGEEVVDVGAAGGANSGAEEDVKIPVGVVALQGVQASAVLGGCEEGDGLAHVRFKLEECTERATEDAGGELFAVESGKSSEAAVDGNVVRAGDEAGEFEVVQGAGLGKVERYSQERFSSIAVVARAELGDTSGSV